MQVSQSLFSPELPQNYITEPTACFLSAGHKCESQGTWIKEPSYHLPLGLSACWHLYDFAVLLVVLSLCFISLCGLL